MYGFDSHNVIIVEVRIWFGNIFIGCMDRGIIIGRCVMGIILWTITGVSFGAGIILGIMIVRGGG